MKKLFALLLCGLTLAFASCKDDEGTTAKIEFRFTQPVVTEISGTAASVSCKVLSGMEMFEKVSYGFTYWTESGDKHDYTEVSVDGNTVSCRLKDLTSGTKYKVVFYVQIEPRAQSQETSFETETIAPDQPTLEITSQTTIPAEAAGDVYTIAYDVINPVDGVAVKASSEAGWINTFDYSVAGEISFVVEDNTEEKDRPGVIVVSYAGAESRQVTVNQKGLVRKSELTITSPSPISATATLGSYQITYAVNNPIAGTKAVGSSEVSWIKSFDNSDDGKIAFVVSENTGSKRSGVIRITYGTAEPCQVTVNQAAAESSDDEKVIELTKSDDFPTSYQTKTVKLGNYQYDLKDVAIFNQTNGIQFKKSTGMLANADDMGAISKIEVTLSSKSSSTKFTLSLGDSKQPSGPAIKSTVSEDGMTYTFDCSASSNHYFKLSSGDGAAYFSSVKIYTGKGGDVPPPVPGAPKFTTPTYSDVTKTSAMISCSYEYTGTSTVSGVYFLYRTSTGSDQRVDMTTDPGVKSTPLMGLTVGTLYSFRLCVVIDGKTYESESMTFVTSGSTVDPGLTKYAGWPELPVEVSNSDYYYAYHLCPDFSVGGHKARNYTVCFSASNHCPLWVAAPRHKCYEVKGTDRTDAYGRDPEIPSNIQYSSKSTGGGCNKGHMLGSAERLVTAATNRQVFYYTNIAPQYSGSFNTGGGAWNNLEGFVDAQVCADTTYVVIGTYFKDFTDAYGTKSSATKISFGGRSDVTRPSMFYYLLLRTKNGNTKKAIKDCTADELQCAAFVMSHEMEKGHKPQAKDMMRVTDIEALIGFTFFANVPNAPKNTYNPSDWGL